MLPLDTLQETQFGAFLFLEILHPAMFTKLKALEEKDHISIILSTISSH